MGEGDGVYEGEERWGKLAVGGADGCGWPAMLWRGGARERNKRGVDAQRRWQLGRVRVLMHRRCTQVKERRERRGGNGVGPTLT